MNLRLTTAATFMACALAASFAPNVYANYTFSGSGTSGNFTGQASEPFAVNYDHQFGGTQPDWGSPGVSAGTTAYLESATAYGRILNFSGAGPIDSNSITIGNDSACAGSTGGGTTFCNTTVGTQMWQAFLTGTDSIEFLAQSPSYTLLQGQQFFVNSFL